MPALGARSHVTLGLCTILHGFTHALGTLLVPLYLLMAADLRLPGVRRAALIVTIYGLVYNALSYAGGMLSDRFDRRWLLGIGLAGNSLAIIAMGLTRQYEMLVVLAVFAGTFGTLFHPCANALVPAHYPKNTGLAIGILGMGSGLGFFAGPQFAGWRAMSGGWHWGAIADWQRPCIELGIAGLIVATLFVILAREARPRATFHHTPDRNEDDDAMLPARISVEAIVTQYTGKEQAHGRAMDGRTRRRVIAIAAILGCRDFAGVASLTAVSLYLQKAHGYDARRAGFIVGTMMLFSILINPLAVYVSPGKRRLPALALSLVVGGVVFALTPAVPVQWVIVILSVFQMCQLGSYAISDAAMLERVDPAVRGRVVGLFLTLAGTLAALSPWVIGSWVDLQGERSHHAGGFVGIFATLGAMMLIAAFSTPIIARLGEPLSNSQAIAPFPGTPGEGRGEGQLIAAK